MHRREILKAALALPFAGSVPLQAGAIEASIPQLKSPDGRRLSRWIVISCHERLDRSQGVTYEVTLAPTWTTRTPIQFKFTSTYRYDAGDRVTIDMVE